MRGALSHRWSKMDWHLSYQNRRLADENGLNCRYRKPPAAFFPELTLTAPVSATQGDGQIAVIKTNAS